MITTVRLPARLLRLFAAAGLILPTAVFSAPAPAEKVFITEVMAANTRTLLDRDREYSDWIELYNAGSTAVNLNGWSLTDEREKPAKWRFPAVSIGPSEYLVVFASGKSRRSPGAELHTNFKLDAEGEYLALIQPDGKTVATEFSPKFQRHAADASFGLSMGGPSSVLVPENSPKKVLVPTRDVGMSWLTPGFDDSTWGGTSMGTGFHTQKRYGSLIALDLQEKMFGRLSSVYLRVPFVVTNAGMETLTLRLRYDDGFVAYLNGWEAARANAPAKTVWNSTAPASRSASTQAPQLEQFDAAAGRFWTYQASQNARPKEHPHIPGATDRYLRLVNGQTANQVNTIAFPFTTAGADSAVIDLDFRFAGTGEGTERLSILLVPVPTYGAEGPGLRMESNRDPNFPGVFAVQLLHNPEDGQSAMTLHWDGSKRATLDVPSASFRQRSFHHARIALEKTQAGLEARITLTANSLTSPGNPVNATSPANAASPATAKAAAILPGLNLANQRLQLAGRIGHWDQTIDVDNVSLHAAGDAGMIGEEFDLTPHLGALKSGTNILGIHVMNHAITDSNLFVLPELLGGFGAVRTNQPLYLAEPTPGAVNRPGFATMAPPPVFLTRSAVYKDSVRIEISAKEGSIRYTLDGSEPTANSTEYSAPIVLNRTALIKARTFLPDHAPSPTVIETFTVAEPAVAAFNSNLPIVVLNSFGRYISANNKSPVSIRFIDSKNGRSSVLGPADYDGRATVNIRGYSTLRQPKNSMTVRLRDENGDKTKVGLFGLPKESDWVLYAPYVDKTLIRDALAYEMSNDMGRYAPRTRFVELYIDRNGGRLADNDYAGVYVLVERITVDKNRVNMEAVSPDDNSEPGIAGGYLFKRDHSERYEPSFRTSQGNRYFYVDPKGTEITREQSAWLQRYVNQFEQALYGSDFRHPDRGYARYLDVDAFIDQHWLIEGTKNIDGFRYSAYVHKPRDGKLTVGPAWDWNLSFGNADYHEGYDPRGWYTELLRDSEICWFRRLSEDPEFMQRTIDRWAELRRTVFSRTRLQRRVDEMAAQLKEAQARNFRRWPVLGRSIHPNYYVGRTYEEEIDWLKDWIGKRIDWIDGQFTRVPSIKTADGKVTLTSSGQIYYTVDGTDPRQAGGQPNPAATLYKGPVTLRADQVLRARAKRGNNWSGLSSTRDKQE